MTRWGVAALAAIVVLGAASVVVARLLGLSGSRPALAVTVTTRWLGAWAVWTFAGTLVLSTGALARYDAAPFAAVALLGALVEYRARRAGAHDRARAIFVGIQLAWLLVVLGVNRLLF